MTWLRRAAWMTAAIAGCVAASCGSCDDEAEDISGGDGTPEVREIALAFPPVEEEGADLLAAPRPELRLVLRQIEAAAKHEDARGLLLRVGPMLGQWAVARDIGGAISKVREAGKPVHCHFDVADNVSYLLLASSCDRISMTPAGYLDLVGVAAHVFYARSLLAHIGVEAELLQIGRYKGAADPFTRDDMPEETRESLGALLDDLHGSLVRTVAARASLSEEEASAVLDGGPYDADGARRAGLVDDVGFDDEAREHARRAAGVDRVRRVPLRDRPEPMGLADLLAALAGEPPSPPPDEPHLVLVQLSGTIVDVEEEGPGGGRAGPFVREMRRIADNDEVKAVVLRIDSPGGSALASDRMWHAVRRVVAKKPVIVSVGGMAASGGYYIASAGSRILAHDESLVGSIGVVGGKVHFADLAERIGLNVVVMPRGRHAAWSSPAQPFSDEERQVLHRLLRSTYRRFLRRVERGRDLAPERVAAAAEGRLMTGRRAREAGLVDEEGGLLEAIALARSEGGLPDDAPIQRWPRKRTPIEALAELLGGGSPEDAAARLASTFGPELAGVARSALAIPTLVARERVLVTVPYVIHVR